VSARGLTLALEETDLTRALVSGRVTRPDCAIRVVVVPTEERHERMLRHEFDVAEYSISQYLGLRDAGDCRFTAIPVFPRRMFVQQLLFCRTDDRITEPRDLSGKRVLISRYQNSVALWLRGYLQHEFSLPPEAIEWIRLRDEALPFVPPPAVRLRSAPAGKGPDQLILEKEVDVLALPIVPDAFLEGAAHIRRLFPDPKRVAIDYFRRTGDFPILHTVVIRDALLEEFPRLAALVRDLFEESKQWYFRYAAQPARLGQAFGSLEREEERAVLGRDPWPYTVADSRPSLDRLTRYAWEQGLTRRRLTVEELFARV
jgi:4,5-dihydroxyphthalate decarboxylase